MFWCVYVGTTPWAQHITHNFISYTDTQTPSLQVYYPPGFHNSTSHPPSVIVLSCAVVQSPFCVDYFVLSYTSTGEGGKKIQLVVMCQACWSTLINSVNQMKGGMDGCGIFRGAPKREPRAFPDVWDQETFMYLCVYVVKIKISCRVHKALGSWTKPIS